uniref:Putative secreted peptide n=1 Tax=Anopheles braziliensis TaxID=58242 RepID=A0A2M3ZVL7_9DIPT
MAFISFILSGLSSTTPSAGTDTDIEVEEEQLLLLLLDGSCSFSVSYLMLPDGTITSFGFLNFLSTLCRSSPVTLEEQGDPGPRFDASLCLGNR